MSNPSNFRHGIASMGVPILGGGGIFSQGQAWFVKPLTGSDGNSGKSTKTALATVEKALTLATANQNDTIYLLSEGDAANNCSSRHATALNWSKDHVHLVGVTAPVHVSQRARITTTSGAAAMSPMVTVSANGCMFKNIQFFHEQANATALVCLSVTGDRNYFENTHIAGIGDATQSAPGSCSLKIDSGNENFFNHCTIGLDTIARDADATEILFDTDSSRNVFEDCYVTSFISAAGFASVTLADVTAIDRYLTFKNCVFHTQSVNFGVTQDQVFSIPTPIAQGRIILMNSYYCTDGASGSGIWVTTGRGNIFNNSVASAAAAAGGEMTKL